MTISPKKNTPALILASGSPRRQQLMEQFSMPFLVKPSSVNEHFDAAEPPEEIVQTLACRKAKAVGLHHSNAVVIGADTIVVHRDNILEKPTSSNHAISMLQKLNNDTHRVITGIALIKTDTNGNVVSRESFAESTKVMFGVIDNEEIKQYVATGSPMDKAGAYGIQDDYGAFFVKRIEGDFYNVVGLPLHALRGHLKMFAPDLF